MDRVCRKWIVDVLQEHPALLPIAARQRAKFEGWLKFELAARIETELQSRVRVEQPTGRGQCRYDIAFTAGGEDCYLELKTSNANWRCPGVEPSSKPITKNVRSIVADAHRLRDCSGRGIVAFVLFPVPLRSDQWVAYIERIAAEAGVAVSARDHCEKVQIALEAGDLCQAVVCCFAVT